MSAALEVREPSARYLVNARPMLLQQFELWATVPEGVTQLRQLILSLAVRGRLFPEHATDATMEKGAADLPCTLPKGWQWIRLLDLGEFRGGKTPSTQRIEYWLGDIPWITPKDMKHLRLSDSQDHVSTKALNDGLALVPPGSLLVVVRSGILRRTVPTAINTVETTINQDLKALVFASPELAPYIQLLVRGFEGFILEKLTKVGTTVESIQFDAFASQRFPLPPLAEQARIVARVDELMRLCDDLEAKGRLEAEQHARLLGTLLGTLTDSASPEELAANWQRVAAHFDLLLDRPEAVDALEQTILQLAIRGLLVRQDSKEEPADALMNRYEAARNSLIAKRSAELARVELEEAPFPLPSGWVWSRFGNVCAVSGGVTLGRKSTLAKPVALPYLRVANVQRWKLNLQSLKTIVVDSSEQARYQLMPGDLLITEGGDWDKVGRTAIWRSELPVCLHQNHVFKSRGYTAEWNPAWAELYLNSDIARNYFAASAKQTTNLASINMSELRHCVFPMPPLAEQARIVASVTELRRLCADLRQRLVVQQAVQTHLADALVEQALA